MAEKGIVISNSSGTARIEWEKIREMRGNIIELVDGQNIIFYDIPDNDIVESVININVPAIDNEGWYKFYLAPNIGGKIGIYLNQRIGN